VYALGAGVASLALLRSGKSAEPAA